MGQGATASSVKMRSLTYVRDDKRNFYCTVILLLSYEAPTYGQKGLGDKASTEREQYNEKRLRFYINGKTKKDREGRGCYRNFFTENI